MIPGLVADGEGAGEGEEVVAGAGDGGVGFLGVAVRLVNVIDKV